ncbi:hypothetical protein F8388_009832 [Cannabis sativa]|uniref:Pentatricopeptide repeat-containing protein n=1 Tax=Cannabis sativa TaxID=3483 RepID=A0A7J6ELP4_CANSA|nr:hypothetical protein G4B88_024045 [Cannabis sativa]KAF4389699.1 hypothetical protein F8388_009832 [Cannabis sativa]
MVKQVGCVPDKETYDILIDGLCREGKFIEANRVLEEMLIKSYWPCVDTFNIVIRGLCSVSRQYESVMLLEEMINQDGHEYKCRTVHHDRIKQIINIFPFGSFQVWNSKVDAINFSVP